MRMNMLSINQGKIILYRLFDVADEIDLSHIEAHITEGTKRMQLSGGPSMKALEMPNPPVSFELAGFAAALFDREVSVQVVARAFDFGVISVSFSISIPAGVSLQDLEAVTRVLDTDRAIDSRALEYTRQLVGSLEGAVIRSSIKEDYTEDYLIITVEKFDQDVEIADFLKQYDLPRLLLFESRALSRQTRDDTLKHMFSYYPDDLAVVNYDNAFLIEPAGSADICDILEFANAQILELRYYDHVLDQQIAWIYRELAKRWAVSAFRLRDYERLARKAAETVAELTEVTEKVDNALKVTEDIYYARIYRTAMALFRSRDWELSIREKLQVVTNTSKMIYDEISTKRGHLLELGIIILIVIEIVILLVMEW